MATTTTRRRTASPTAAAPRRRRRKLSAAGVRLIAGFEGFRSDLYNDAAGHCTIGYGHIVHTGNCDGSESAEFRRARRPEDAGGAEGVRRSGRKCSPNFAFGEFKSSGNGWIKVSRELVLGLEDYRELVGKPVTVVSGSRDPQKNASIPGAAKNSQHMYGNACDLELVKPTAAVKALKRFSGIGYQGASGLVSHVDVRHVGPNTTKSSVRDPAIWIY